MLLYIKNMFILPLKILPRVFQPQMNGEIRMEIIL